MQGSTISIRPVPQSITPEQIRNIFHAYSIKNVNIQGKTAYVEFSDSGDLETLQIQFADYEIPQLNNAKIDVAQDYDWNSFKKDDSIENKLSSNSSSDKHEDLMSADIKNLIVIQNCDKIILNHMTIQSIKQIFAQYKSVNRIIKKDNQVVIQFLDPNEIELLEMKFDDFTVPALGKNTKIQKAEDANVSSDDFTSQWSKINAQQSQITQATTNYGYQDEKPIQSIAKPSFGYDSQTASNEVLHHQIIPPFDKKTSMEVNFLNQQSKLGYNQQKKQKSHEPIYEANTKQQLDFTSELNIQQDDRFGFEAAQKAQQIKKQEQLRKKKQEEQKIKKKEEQRRLKEQEQRKIKEEQQRKIKEEQQRRRKFEQQNRKRQQQQRKRKQEQEILRKLQEQKRRQAQQQERLRRLLQEQTRKRRQSELIDKQLKQKLKAQRQKHLKQQQQKKKEQQRKQQQRKQQQRKAQQARKLFQQKQRHRIPTQSENAAKQTQALLQTGEEITKQLGYAVNKAKQQSINLINSGKQLLKNAAQKMNTSEFGYQEQLKQKNINSKTGIQKLGYEDFSVKPDVNVPRPVSGTQRHIPKTLVTVTLAIWVLFLLFQ